MRTISVPPLTDEFGFRWRTGSVPTNRTMMLAELTQALDRVPANAPTPGYFAAIVDENVLVDECPETGGENEVTSD
jgi:hypothetical protein